MKPMFPKSLRPVPWCVLGLSTGVTFFVCLLSASTRATEPVHGPDLLLTGGKIYTETDKGVLNQADILIREGKIAALGPNLDPPAGVRKIAIDGMVVTPGFIDSRGVLGLTDDARRESGSDGSLKVLDGVDPYADDWRDVARSGVTAVYIQPAETGVFGGSGALLRVGPAMSVDELTIRSDLAVQAAIGVNPPTANSLQRFAQYESLKRSLDRVKKYKEDWAKYQEDLKKYDEAKKKYDEAKKKYDAEAKAKGAAETGKSEKTGTPGGDGPSGIRPGTDNRGGVTPATSPVDPERLRALLTKMRELPEGIRARLRDPNLSIEERKALLKEAGWSDEEIALLDQMRERMGGPLGTSGTTQVQREEPPKAQSKSEAEGAPKPPEAPKEPAKDPTREFLVQLIDRKIPIRLEAHRPEDLRNALALADEFKLRLILEGVSQPGSVLATLDDRRVPMILGPVLQEDEPPSYRRGRTRDWLTSLTSGERRWALATFGRSPAESARLREDAAIAVARGVPSPAVLKAITSGAAQLLGVDDLVGSIAEGKRADLAVFAGDPLDVTAPIRLVLSGGAVIYENEMVHPAQSEDLVDKHQGPTALPPAYLLKSTRILTPDGKFAAGVLRIVDGKITERAETLPSNDGEPLIDLGQAVITPGLMLMGIEAPSTSSAEPESLEIHAVDSFDPGSPRYKRMMAEGVLTVGLFPGQGSVLGGLVGIVRPGSRDPIVSRGVGVRLGLDGSSRDPQRFPVSLDGQISLVEAALTDRLPPSRLLLPDAALRRIAQERSNNVEALKKKKLLAFFEVREPREVDAALDLSARHGLKPVLVGPIETADSLDRLASLGASLMITPSSSSRETRVIDQAIKASSLGIPLLFSAPDAVRIRSIVARAVSQGLPREKALASLTADAAALVGLPSSICGLQAGSSADFVAWTGSPLDLRAHPILVVVDGQVVEPPQ